ncbi:putative ribonuclease H-like domain-containing protein [Tanacetum coccineum]
MLLMALPNEHLLTFNQYKDAKTLFAAIQTRFGGNDDTKKTQKTLLKQMLQKIISQLAILGENNSQKDLNWKFLRSLPFDWNTHVAVWRNKPDLDTMSFDDLYNNFKIVEQEVKGTISSSSQNVAFMLSSNNTNEVNIAYEVSTANLSDATIYAFLANQPNGSQLVHEKLEQIYEDDLEEMDLKWQLALLSMRIRKFFQKTGRKITINGIDTTGYDKLKVECFNYYKLGHFARECRGPRNQDNRSRNQDNSRRTINVEEISSKAMLAIDGAGFDWSFMTDGEVPTEMALMAFSDSEFKKSEFNLATYKRGLASVEEQLVFYKKNEVLFCEQLAVLKSDISYKDSKISVLKSELEKLKQEKESNQLKIEKFDNASKSLDKLIGSQIPDKSRKDLGFVSYNAVLPPPTRLFSLPSLDLSYSGLEEFQQLEFEGYGPKTSKSVNADTSNEVRESPDASLVEELVSNDKLEKKTIFPTIAKINFVRPQQQEKPVRKPVKYAEMYRLTAITIKGKGWNIVPRAVLMKTGLRPLNTARPVNTAHPKTTVYSARPMSCFSKSAQSTVKRPYQIRTTLTNKNFSQKVNTAKGKFYTARPKAVNTARPNSTVVNAVRANQVNAVKASACWVWRPTKLNSASITLKRHNYGHPQKEDQGYVDSGCSRHMTGNMSYLSDFKEFDRGYMCDKKNSVLFTDTGCFVLSPDFKLADESQVLLKVPRKNNMYSVDMKNIVPKESLTCLVAKATLDESMLWHRRLGHVKFKTINKLVKENLVRGLPTKHFENDQTCVACLKGKQHKASCKSKIQNSITQPLFMLHMDLFGLTFVSSLMNKKYCLVVTDDYSRFTWVFFLATKDETSGILKSFITEIENLVDKKVKIIRCDNGTEFKNSVMSKFNGKSDEGFFIGYSLNSKAFRVYNTRTRKVEENLHVRFLEDKPIIADNRPEWLFDIDMLTKLMNYVPVVAGTNSNDFAGTKDSIGAGHSSKEMGSSQDCILMLLDAERKEHGVIKESGIDNQERPENSSQDINTAGPSINTASTNITTVPSTLNTIIHKDHSLDHVIGDVQSSVQTRRMTTTSNEQGFISAVYEGKTHEDLNTCLFACFLSQIEPTRVAKALSDPTWVFRNKKDKRGIVIKNKVRLVAHGYTQEEGIDYDEVFAPVAKIEAIRLFLAYASFMGFMVYQMDIKSAFLYERIEEEVKSEQALYMVCFQVSQEPDESIYGELTFFLGLQVKQKQDGIFISHDKYVVKVLRKFNFSDVKSASTPLDTKKTLVKDADGDTLFELVAYTDSNYARASLDRKSTTRGCQFLGSRLISWQCKKQTVVATSTTKAKYVAAASCCGQTSEPIPNVADKAVYEEWGDRVERASTTAASLDAEQASATVRLQEELDEEERQKMARVHEAAQSFTEEEWENIKARVKANEELAQSNKQGKGTKAELDHEGSKRQKTNEASRSVQEQFDEEEKELSKGILMLMLVNKLLVDQHSEMANELLRRIFI